LGRLAEALLQDETLDETSIAAILAEARTRQTTAS
jgi:hypothetical protein